MSDFETKRAERIARYKARAEKAREESREAFEESSRMASVIPMGQPILVGHHSEKSDRAYRGRIAKKMDQSCEAQKRAEYWAERARGAERSDAISSDDPEAAEKLKARIVGAEKLHDIMTQANAIVRSKPRNVETEEKRSALLGLGLRGHTVAGLFKKDFCGRIGFPSWQIRNNKSNIARMRQRLEDLEAAAARETVDRDEGVCRVVENAELNRVQLIFDGKPEETTRKLLKRHGFRWSPREGAWQRHLNESGLWAANHIIRQLAQSEEAV